jgi:hypothetical protein
VSWYDNIKTRAHAQNKDHLYAAFPDRTYLAEIKMSTQGTLPPLSDEI